MRDRVHVEASSRAEMTDALRKAGLDQSADRLDYLRRLAEEDPDEEPIALESLRQLTAFLIDERELGEPRIGVSPGRRRPGAMASLGGRDSRYGVPGLGADPLRRHDRSGFPKRGVATGEWRSCPRPGRCKSSIRFCPDPVLCKGDPVPDDDHVSRYGKPSSVDAHGLPLASAFQLRSHEDSLSVNWLKTLGARSVDAAIGRVRAAFFDSGFRAAGQWSICCTGRWSRQVGCPRRSRAVAAHRARSAPRQPIARRHFRLCGPRSGGRRGTCVAC